MWRRIGSRRFDTDRRVDAAVTTRPADAGLVLSWERELFSDRYDPIGKPTLTPVSKGQAYGGEMTKAQRLADSGTAFAPMAS